MEPGYGATRFPRSLARLGTDTEMVHLMTATGTMLVDPYLSLYLIVFI